MTSIIKEVGFTTDPMGEVSSIKLEFSDKELSLIKKHRAYLEANTDIFKIVMNFDGELLDEDGEQSEFRSDGGELFIFKGSLYYFTQSKFDGSVQVESESINMCELFTENESMLTESNPIKELREDCIHLYRLNEIWSISYKGIWYEAHVNATGEREIYDTFAESGKVTPEIYKHLEEVVSKIDNI